MPTVALNNLGCSKNQIDGERILGLLVQAGFSVVSDFSRAEVIIVNTCAFIREAKQEAIDAILEMARFKKMGNCRTLVVAGCFSQRFGGEARIHLPEVDAWLGVHDWPHQLRTLFRMSRNSSSGRILFPPVATQYLKISEGCSHRCSFCIIPRIRGPFKSRPERDIVREASWLYSQGVKECICVAQDTSQYGKDLGSSLVRLLHRLLKETEFPWIRLMYLHPHLVNDDFLRLIASEKRLLPYLDIPLQHISDDILVSMNRRPLSKGIYRLVERIRTVVPEAAIRTTFIVGYPGETKKHFEELLAFIETVRFERVGVFPYSPEQGTQAYSLKKRLKNEVLRERCELLMSLQREISAGICASRIGKTLDVIIDGPEADCGLEGRTAWDAPEVDGTVHIPAGSLPVGAIAPVRIISASDYDLRGEPAAR